MFIKGKAIGLVASIYTIFISSITFIVLYFAYGFFKLSDFEYNFIEYLTKNGFLYENAQMVFIYLKIYIDISRYISLFIASTAIISMVLLLMLRPYNVRWIGISIIIISFIMLLTLRVVSFILYIICAYKLIKVNEKPLYKKSEIESV